MAARVITARRFEYRDGSSDKFWTIQLQGNSHTVTFGRAGTAGQTKTKTFASSVAARADHDALVTAKLAKGYAEVAPSRGDAGAARVAKGKAPSSARATKVAPSPLVVALERLKKQKRDEVANLHEGASPAALKALERAHGLRFPADLRELWSIHDGQRDESDSIFGGSDSFGLDFLSAGEACEESFAKRSELAFYVQFCRKDPTSWEEAGVTPDEIASDDWVAFARMDHDMVVVCCGSGQVFTAGVDAPPFRRVASSVTEWLEQHALALENDRETVEQRKELEQRAKVAMRDARRELAKALGSYGGVSVELTERPNTVSESLRLLVRRPFEGERLVALRSVVEANARTLLLRHSIRGADLVSEAILPVQEATRPWIRAILKCELENLRGDGAPTTWRRHGLTAEEHPQLHEEGRCLTLTKDDDFWRVEGECLVHAGAVAQTLQMRSFLALRAPTTESGLAILNEKNQREGSARVFVFENQIGVGAGTVLEGTAIGTQAENAYWGLRALLDELSAHGDKRSRPVSPDSTSARPIVSDEERQRDAQLAKRAKACLTQLASL